MFDRFFRADVGETEFDDVPASYQTTARAVVLHQAIACACRLRCNHTIIPKKPATRPQLRVSASA